MTIAAPIFAIVTPMTEDRNIDFAALRRYLEFLSDNGVSRIISGGTTGEFANLTLAERKTLLEQSRAYFPGEVLAHVSATTIADVRDLLAHAAQHADAALLLPPYYYADAPPAGIVDFLAESAKGSTLPLYLYNFPRHTQLAITPEILSGARERIPSLRGVKDSSGSIEKALGLARAADGLEIYVGSDSNALRVLQEKLAGSVTGGANPVPAVFRDLYSAYHQGDMAGAEAAQAALNAWSDLRKAMAAPEIPVVKAALAGLIPGFGTHVRLPLVPLSPETAAEASLTVRTFLDSLHH